MELIAEKKERRARVPAHIARGALLEVAVELFCCYGIDVVTMEQLAQASQLNKMSVYRLFGSRDALVLDCARWLREKEERHWVDALAAMHDSPAESICQLFRDLSRRMVRSDHAGRALSIISRYYGDAGHPVRLEFATHKAALRSLLLRVANDLRINDTEKLVDTLLLVWEGAVLNDSGSIESRRIAACLPEVAERILLWHAEEPRPQSR